MEREIFAVTPDGTARVMEARPDQFEELWGVQRRAFSRLAAAVGVPAEEFTPVAEPLGDLEQLARTGWRFFVAEDAQGQVVGTVRGCACSHDGASIEIGRLAADDGWTGRGLGRALMEGLEAAFPQAARFELFTGEDLAGPRGLYERLGYRVYRSEVTPRGFTLIWMEKCR